jgi:hypothetical protein
MKPTTLLLPASFVLAAACGSDPDSGNLAPDSAAGQGLDATRGGADALAIADAADGVVTIPTWMLEDVQPASPRLGQTYGVDSFGGRVVVVTLLEGF